MCMQVQINEIEKGILVYFYIQAGASKSKVIGEFRNMIKLQICAPPVDGKANIEIIKFLSKVLNIQKSNINIVSGERQKIKKIEILGYSKKDFMKCLEDLINNG